MMEAANTSESLVNLSQKTRRNNPEDSHLHTHRRESLKSYYINVPRLLFSSVFREIKKQQLLKQIIKQLCLWKQCKNSFLSSSDLGSVAKCCKICLNAMSDTQEERRLKT
jgi:hypothetical protein